MTDRVVEQFEAFVRNGGGTGPAWLPALRRQAIDQFQRTGYPTTRDEEWRFTPIGPIAKARFALPGAAPVSVAPDALEPFLFGHREWARLVFVDGRFVPELSQAPSAAGLRIRPLSRALEEDPSGLERDLFRHAGPAETPFTALNAAFAMEGAVVEVAPDATVADPVHLVFVASTGAEGVAMHPRVLVRVGARARAQLVESYVGLVPAATYFTNAVTEVVVERGAWLEHTRIQRESEAAYHIAFTQVDQGTESHYRSFSLAMGGAIARHNLTVRLNEPNVESLLYGLYIGRASQLIDNHTTIHHDQPDCRSWEVYKGVLDGHAHGVFNGKILVRPEAQKTDAKQTNRALLLSDTASVDTKPQLEIFADDVKCTHGAAVGRIDEQAFFYLQSRGIPRAAARRLLTYAFAAEVVGEVASEPVRVALERVVRERLASD